MGMGAIMAFLQLFTIVAVILLTMRFSGSVVLGLTCGVKPSDCSTSPTDADHARLRQGMLIGKMENILIVLFVAANSITALALVFTAKSLVRKEEMTHDPGYYLVGTLANFTFSVAMGFFARFLLAIMSGTPFLSFGG
jgi:hypothetical protein